MRIVHIDSIGKVLFKSKFYTDINSFEMMEPDEVMLVDKQEMKINIINLKTYETIHPKH